MVETEIIRLESQISHLQTNLAQEKKVTRETKSVKWKDATILNSTHTSSSSSLSELPPSSKPSLIKGFGENMAFETKALHFISKAIKGDYNLSDFSIHEKLKSSRASFPEQKENHFNHEVGFQERLSRKSGILKPPSPFRDSRHKTPKVNHFIRIEYDNYCNLSSISPNTFLFMCICVLACLRACTCIPICRKFKAR